MDNFTIFTKTAKGLGEALGKTKSLSREQRKILKEIDGKASMGDLLEQIGMDDARLQAAIGKLLAEDYIREFGSAAPPGTYASGETVFGLTAPGQIEAANSQLTIGDFFRAMEQPQSQSQVDSLDLKDLPPDADAMRKAHAENAAQVEQARRAIEEEARRITERAQLQAAEMARRQSEQEARRAAEQAGLEAKARQAAEQARRQAEEQARRQEQARAKQEAETKARREAEERARKEAAEAERQASIRAAQEARRLAEEAARREAEAREKERQKEQARREAEELARRQAEEQARKQAEQEARKLAEEQAEARKQAEEQARRQAEEEARRAAEARARAAAEEQARVQAENARLAAEARAREEAEAQARREAEEQARKLAEAQAQKAAQEQTRIKAWEAARRAAEELAQREAEAKEKAEAEQQERLRAEEKARLAAEEQARRQAEEAARRQAEEQARREAEEQARLQAEEQARLAAEEQARREAEAQAEREARERARKEAEEAARLQAEEKARQKAEAKARKEAEALARQEAREQARREAEEKARLEAERKAQQAAEAKARKEAEQQAKREAREKERQAADEAARLKAEEAARTKAEKAAQKAAASAAKAAAPSAAATNVAEADVAATRPTLQETPAAMPAESMTMLAGGGMRRLARAVDFGRLIRLAALAMVILAAAGVALLHVVPFNGRLAQLEQDAGAQFGQPVRIGGLKLSLFPHPHWRLQQVAIGGQAQITVPQLNAGVELGSLFSGARQFKSVELISPVIDDEGLGWILFGRTSNAAWQTASLSATDVRLRSRHVQLPAFDASAELDGESGWRKIRLSASAAKLHIDLQRAASALRFELTANDMALPFGGALAFDTFNASGAIAPDALEINKFTGVVYDGTVSGTGILRWKNGWSLTGEAQARQLAPAKLTPALLQSGALDGNFKYAMQASEAGKLLVAPQVRGSFAIGNGVLLGVDMASQVMGQAGSGKTSFNEISSDFMLAGGKLQLSRMRLAAGLLSAIGDAAADPFDADGKLSGRFTIDLRTASRQAHSSLNLAGTPAAPQFSR